MGLECKKSPSILQDVESTMQDAMPCHALRGEERFAHRFFSEIMRFFTDLPFFHLKKTTEITFLVFKGPFRAS